MFWGVGKALGMPTEAQECRVKFPAVRPAEAIIREVLAQQTQINNSEGKRGPTQTSVSSNARTT